jgi:hypothetical protein
MVDVGLASDVLVALFDFSLSSLVLLGHIALAILVLSKLDFNVTQGVLELLIFNLTKAQHLSVFNFRTFLSFDT